MFLLTTQDRNLRDMGVLVGAEREAMLEKQKTVPFITNLHEDPMMSEQFVFFSEAGKDITVGSKNANPPKDVKLSGAAVMTDHAAVSNDGTTISVAPGAPGAKVYVNGDQIRGPTELHHLDRIVFGTSHVYKLVVPAEAAAGRVAQGADVPDAIDYEFAISEMNKGQLKIFAQEVLPACKCVAPVWLWTVTRL
jgi:hypothetical protein